MEELLTTKQYAELHGVSQRTVQRWLAEGLIYGAKIGRGFKISSDEVPPTDNYSLPAEGTPVEQPTFDPFAIADSYPRELPPDQFEPEPFEDDAEFDEDVDGIETRSEGEFDREHLRRIFSSLAEAQAYAEEIPVPTLVFRRSEDGLFQVVVEYP